MKGPPAIFGSLSAEMCTCGAAMNERAIFR
jgi:hypothetical protein